MARHRPFSAEKGLSSDNSASLRAQARGATVGGNADILDVEATPTRISKEVDANETMVSRVEGRFALKANHIAGDTA